MAEYQTVFGSLADFKKGGVSVIDDSPKNYVFSNVFEVATNAKPYERIAVAKNFEYVIEAVRADGQSPWFTCAHDEFALAMDGEVEVHLIKLADPDAVAEPGSEGARKIDGNPDGKKMGRIVLRKGHMALLPTGAAYRFATSKPCVVLIQTIDGPITVHKWAEICQS